jgi:hypothetical protein
MEVLFCFSEAARPRIRGGAASQPDIEARIGTHGRPSPAVVSLQEQIKPQQAQIARLGAEVKAIQGALKHKRPNWLPRSHGSNRGGQGAESPPAYPDLPLVLALFDVTRRFRSSPLGGDLSVMIP